MKLRQLKGTKDYLPEEQLVREKIVDVLKKNFKKYGFKPVETSILEFYDIAASKYAGGEEILKETYKLRDQGNRLLCLRYELTFKLAKLLGLNPNLRLPLKRYEIGKVFRDGPVKAGRLREFTQCDVDVIGVKGSVADAEFMPLIFDVFSELGLTVLVQVNNRKFLFGLFEFCGIKPAKFVDVALSLDKLEKIGEKAVKKELEDKKINPDKINKLFSLLKLKQESNKDKISFFEKTLTNELSKKGIEELKEFFRFSEDFGIAKDVVFVPTLARGLGYYTGLMWEVFLKQGSIKSSIAAGGRWDNMIQNFLGSKQEFPATGMTFGLDVIFEALKSEKFSKEVIPSVLIIPINTLDACLGIASQLRKDNISTDVAFEKKLSKALDYANKEGIPFVVFVGKEELKKKKVKLRNMKTGKESVVAFKQIKKKII
ncbi:histidine--tRNA ligase [Candidatus Woesearchaeota archaeon ex4484_78]|nr:MAG: histidine--tRNA ligase [Candidatus Woesearchaeota archaeon ex4484_78]